MTNNTFNTIEGLVEAIKVDMPFYNYITVDYVRSLGIKKSYDGKYHKSDFIMLISKIDIPDLKKFPRSHPNSQRITLAGEYPILKLDPIKFLERTAQIEGYDFSLRLLSKKYIDFVSECRQKLLIPQNGFENRELLSKWFTKTSTILRKFGYLKGKNNNLSFWDLLLNKVSSFLETDDLFRRKNSNLKHLFEWMLLDYITLNDPFNTICQGNKGDSNSKLSYGFSLPLPPKRFSDDNLEIHLSVYNTTTKDELKRIIDSAWPTIENYKKRFPSSTISKKVKDVNGLQRKIVAYLMRLDGYTTNQIATKLKTNSSNIRKMINDVDKELRRIEKV